MKEQTEIKVEPLYSIPPKKEKKKRKNGVLRKRLVS